MRMEKKYVRRRRILATVLIIAAFWWLMDITTPKECKVSIDKMSYECKKLLYP